MLQRRAAGADVEQVPPIVHDVLRSPGQPLDAATRAFMEPRFGRDFSGVRVHTDARAAESASAVNAHAYTVGNNVVFGTGKHQPHSEAGRRLMAHELTHVVQQGGTTSIPSLLSIASRNSLLEREAEIYSSTIEQDSSLTVPMAVEKTASTLQRHRDDLVAYGGGQTSRLTVVKAGKIIYTTEAVSGHPGHGESELSVGPIPRGIYTIRPGDVRRAVTKPENGTCGAAAINSGYQRIYSTDPVPCEGSPAHYCNVPCPTPTEPSRVCFTPQDCWGTQRIRIEGSRDVVDSSGKVVHRDGFYIHGGNRSDPVSSGCVKSLDEDVFNHVRSLTGVRGAVTLCIGSACDTTILPKAEAQYLATLIESLRPLADAVRREFYDSRFGPAETNK